MEKYFIATREADQEVDANVVSPLSESSRSSLDSLASLPHLTGADEKQDLESLTLILNYLNHDIEQAHDEEVKRGMASFLIKVLHNSLLRRTNENPDDGSFFFNVYRDSLGKSCALRVSIVISALEMVLRCSDATMSAFVDTMPVESLPTLVILIEIVSDQSGSRTIKEVILSKTARVLRRLCAHGIPIRIVLVEALFTLLKAETDTMIDAACAVASLAARRTDKLHRFTIPRIEHMSHSLICTLTTAASSLPEDQAESVLDAILNLTTSSNVILVNIARRSTTIRILGQSMKSTKPEIRRNAIMVSENLLASLDGFIELIATQPFNGKKLLLGLTSAAMNEGEAELQHYATSILTKTLTNMNGSLEHAFIIADALAILANSAIQDRTAHEAAIALCNKAPTLDVPSSQENICTAIAELAQSSSTLVRSAALRALNKLCSSPSTCRSLAAQASFHEAIVSNVTEGSIDQASAAMEILRQAACEKENREAICQSSSLRDLLVGMVVRNSTTTNRKDYLAAVELILCLVSEPSCITSFLHYADLIPSLVTLANSNASSKQLKNDTVDAIVRLTSNFLDE